MFEANDHATGDHSQQYKRYDMRVSFKSKYKNFKSILVNRQVCLPIFHLSSKNVLVSKCFYCILKLMMRWMQTIVEQNGRNVV